MRTLVIESITTDKKWDFSLSGDTHTLPKC